MTNHLILKVDMIDLYFSPYEACMLLSQTLRSLLLGQTVVCCFSSMLSAILAPSPLFILRKIGRLVVPKELKTTGKEAMPWAQLKMDASGLHVNNSRGGIKMLQKGVNIARVTTFSNRR